MRCVHSDVCKHTGGFRWSCGVGRSKNAGIMYSLTRPSSAACYGYYYYASSKTKMPSWLHWCVTFYCPISLVKQGDRHCCCQTRNPRTSHGERCRGYTTSKIEGFVYLKRSKRRRELWQMTARLRSKSGVDLQCARVQYPIICDLLSAALYQNRSTKDIPNFDWHTVYYIDIYRPANKSL